MKKFTWNIWTVILAIVAVIFGIRVLAKVFSWMWVLGSIVFSVLVWVAAALLLVWGIRFLFNKVRGR